MSVYTPKWAACCRACPGRECPARDLSLDKHIIAVGIGGCRIAAGNAVLKTTLGSCVAVALYDRLQKLAGLIHVMLPTSARGGGRLTKFADTGIPLLINCMMSKTGSRRSALVAKMFGGAKMFKAFSQAMDIGYSNIEACRSVLKQEGVNVVGGKTGGTQGTQIMFTACDGKVVYRTIGGHDEVY